MVRAMGARALRASPWRIVPAAILLLTGLGCSTPRPWERGHLAHPAMDPSAPQQSICGDFPRHTFDIREGSSGGHGQAGGGCGCN